MRKILISIKPNYVKDIFRGEKKYEYRKRVPSHVESAIVYATAPVKCIVGEMKVGGVLSMSPEDLWDISQKYSGLTRKDFFQYFKDCSVAHALCIENVFKYDIPIKLEALNISRPPQSWQYLD